jgi:serine-type D-Ala-D-Ala carboxypeptidase (penicillin-binding protein 5/6)
MHNFLKSNAEYIGTATLAAIVVFIIFLVDVSSDRRARVVQDDLSIRSALVPATEGDPFENIVLEAKAAYVLDARTGTSLFAYNSNSQLPLASLTKVMTALTAQDIIPDDADVVIRAEDVLTEGDSGLVLDELWSREKLASFMLLVSSNDAASALASTANLLLSDNSHDSPKSFIDAMNFKARSLGLSQTFFVNPTGLDVNRDVGGAYGSARDVAFLMHQALLDLPQTIALTSSDSIRFFSENNIIHSAENTNDHVKSIPGIAASKTGITELAGGNLAIVVDTSLNRPIVVVVLGSTREGRFRDAIGLVRATYQALTSRQQRND